MSKFRLLSSAEQVAAHLRKEMEDGRLQGVMPGVLRLEAKMGVNRKTVDAAMRILERDGLLLPQGPRRRRLIARPEGRAASGLRVKILGFEAATKREHYMVDLQHHLNGAGHHAEYAPKTLLDLGMDASRVAQLVGQSKADAWIVFAGSREILEWFSAQPVPVFALMGRRLGLPLAAAGPDKTQAISEAVRRLVALGHRRIVMLVRENQRKPRLSTVVQKAFFDELQAHGIHLSSYNLPDWEETPRGFRTVLESLFKVTRPTALILEEAWGIVPTLQFCLLHGIQIPRDLSLVCCDPDRSTDWCIPPVSHVRWDPNPMVRRVVRWVDNVARGKSDLRQTFTHAEFVPAGTIGPVRATQDPSSG